MSTNSKEIHIVFRVLNFIYSPLVEKYNLLANDKLLLINLAKHKGAYGIFPSQKTLAKELELSVRYIRERLHYLASLGLILIKRKGVAHYYELPELGLIEEPQFPYVEMIEEPQFPYKRNPSSSNSGTTAATNNCFNNPSNNKKLLNVKSESKNEQQEAEQYKASRNQEFTNGKYQPAPTSNHVSSLLADFVEGKTK